MKSSSASVILNCCNESITVNILYRRCFGNFLIKNEFFFFFCAISFQQRHFVYFCFCFFFVFKMQISLYEATDKFSTPAKTDASVKCPETSFIHPGTQVGQHVTIGEHTSIYPGVNVPAGDHVPSNSFLIAFPTTRDLITMIDILMKEQPADPEQENINMSKFIYILIFFFFYFIFFKQND